MAFVLRARVVFPVDRPAIEGGVVTIEGERIVDVGAKPQTKDVADLGDVALLPGLVNAHTHLEFSYLQRPLGKPGMRLVDWIRLVIAERGRTDIAPVLSTDSGWTESRQYGATTVCDIVSRAMAPGVWSGDILAAIEVIGFSRARAASALSAVIEQLDRSKKADGGYAVTAGRGASFAISPHAPYTVSPELLRQLVDLAISRKLLIAMHVAESAEELELLDSGTGQFQALLDERSMWDAEAVPRGSRPMDYLRMLAVAPRTLVIHGNYLQEDERAFLASHRDRMSLVYCPRTHAYFGHPRYPLPELLKAGVCVALGTDSRASNPDLDLLAEMRHVARSYPEIEPQAVLRLGTLAGAEALGRAADVGSITPGKFADLVAVPIDNVHVRTTDDVLDGILSGVSKPTAVWLRGDRLR
jgi:cytosine/adenosine deaminase-related metal-dependent hydrolase